jgi:hypothetical protein
MVVLTGICIWGVCVVVYLYLRMGLNPVTTYVCQ